MALQPKGPWAEHTRLSLLQPISEQHEQRLEDNVPGQVINTDGKVRKTKMCCGGTMVKSFHMVIPQGTLTDTSKLRRFFNGFS